MIIDTGANVNLIDEVTWAQLASRRNLEYAEIPINPYSGPPLQLLGKCKATFKANGKTLEDNVYVASGSGGNLLGHSTAESLGVCENQHEQC